MGQSTCTLLHMMMIPRVEAKLQARFLSCDCGLQGVAATMRQSYTGDLGTGLAILGAYWH